VTNLLDTAGPAAPPRKNGELTFAAPWESRVFGLALALHRRGLFAWDEFRARLITAIAERELAAGEDAQVAPEHDHAAGEDALIAREHDHAAGEWSYYACWLTALERLLADKGLCPPAEVDARATALAARPAGHDHNH
jgi:nitrile hydratase accessory protein